MTGEIAKAGLTGGCQCGAVRYRLDAPPTDANLCHCRMCQKAAGAPVVAFANLPADKFVLTAGTLGAFVSSAIAERGFCAACGTPLTYRGLGSARISVTTGSLDDPNAVPPEMQLGVESRVPWLEAALATPEMRTEEWLASKKLTDAGSRQHPDRET